MKHPAKFDQSEDPADLVFNQSNLKTVFSKAQLGWKLSQDDFQSQDPRP